MGFFRIIRNLPFVRIVVPFIFGIVAALHINLPVNLWVLACVAIVLCVYFYYKKRKPTFNQNILFSVFLVLYLFCSGVVITEYFLSKSQPITFPDNSLLVAQIIETPKETEKSVSIQIEIEAFKAKKDWYSTHGKAVVYLQKDSLSQKLKAGHYIGFVPKFDRIKNAGNPNEFDYARYMAFHMINSQAYLKSGSWCFLGGGGDASLHVFFRKMRERLLQVYIDAGLQGDEFAVAAALSLGYKDKLQDKLKHAYSSSGAMHVLAVSGLHVGIIYVILQFVFGFLIKSRKLALLKVLLIIFFIWFYALLTGMSPSVSRSAIMFSFISIGKLYSREISIYNILGASAFVTLFINPLTITELGFWLSYLAVYSIVTLFPIINKLFKFKSKILKRIWSLVAVSISAQVATAPLTIFYFHQFSNYFLLTNLIVIPLVTLIIYLIILLSIFSFIPLVGKLIGSVLAFIIEFLNNSVVYIERLPGAVSENLNISNIQMIILYATVVSFLFYLILRQRRALYLVLLFLSVFMIQGIVKNIRYQENQEFIVYNVRGVTAINFIIGQENTLFSDLQSPKLKSSEKYFKNHWISRGIKKEKYINLDHMTSQFMISNLWEANNPKLFQKENYIATDLVSVVIIRDDRYKNKEVKEKVNIDYVIISENAEVSMQTVSDLFELKCLIFDSSNSNYYCEQKIREALQLGISVFNVSKQGAFHLNLCSHQNE